MPIIKEAIEFGSMGFVPIGAHKNREYRQNMVVAPDGFDPVLRDILFDPQTSGGLLIGCGDKEALPLVQRLHEEGIDEAAIVGFVSESRPNKIQII